MKAVALCYIQKLDKSGLVLGVLNPRVGAWGFPGGKVDPGIESAAIRELHEEAGLVPILRTVMNLYIAVSSHDPSFMVHVYGMDVGPQTQPQTREPGHTVAWVTPFQLCDSKAYGPFYQKFFRSRGVVV
jgi:8-oxo-dGTP pyrophosphatase MutT (NUDIX family)